MNGIRILSTINSRIYMVLGLFVFLFGPTAYILKLTVEGFGISFPPSASPPSSFLLLTETAGQCGGRYSIGATGWHGCL